MSLREHLLPLTAESAETTKKRISDRGICWYYPPTANLSWDYFLSIRGSENFHSYLWILKDFSWTQEWYYPAWVFGSLAVIVAVALLFNAAYERATNEVFIRMAVLIWIFANWWWITAEVHDWNYPDEPPQYDEHTIQTAYILDAGLCWLGIYYLIVKPFKLFDADNPEKLKEYDTTGLPSRSPMFFHTWREYENFQ